MKRDGKGDRERGNELMRKYGNRNQSIWDLMI